MEGYILSRVAWWLLDVDAVDIGCMHSTIQTFLHKFNNPLYFNSRFHFSFHAHWWTSLIYEQHGRFPLSILSQTAASHAIGLYRHSFIRGV